MNTSSAQNNSSITFVDNLDTITLNTGTSSYDTITIDPNYNYQYSTGATVGGITSISGAGGSAYTIGSLSTSQVNTISSINISDFKIDLPEEWVNCFPDFSRIEKMCEEYPGLKIAYNQFKTVYALVRDDYDTPKDQRVKP
jgi:hypothetical protein